MANPQQKTPSQPRIVRLPPEPAQGLDDEFTAQPRPLSDELGSADGGEAGLSVEPEDMGARWLSEATEQGEAVPHTRLESELTLTTGPDTDDVLTPPNFEYENTLWEQTVDLMTETQGAADQLRGPAAIEDESDPSEREPELGVDRDLSANDADVREFSLLDRVTEAGDDTIAPDIEAEDQGRHARTTPRHEYGAQVEDAIDPEQARLKNRPNRAQQSPSVEGRAAPDSELGALMEQTPTLPGTLAGAPPTGLPELSPAELGALAGGSVEPPAADLSAPSGVTSHPNAAPEQRGTVDVTTRQPIAAELGALSGATPRQRAADPQPTRKPSTNGKQKAGAASGKRNASGGASVRQLPRHAARSVLRALAQLLRRFAAIGHKPT
jgi:hypothetical protein